MLAQRNNIVSSHCQGLYGFGKKKKLKKNQLHLTAAMLMSNYATASKLGKLSETQFSDLKTEEHIDS